MLSIGLHQTCFLVYAQNTLQKNWKAGEGEGAFQPYTLSNSWRRHSPEC